MSNLCQSLLKKPENSDLLSASVARTSTHPQLPCTTADAPFISGFARSIKVMPPATCCKEIKPSWDKRQHRSISNIYLSHSLPFCLSDNQINAHVSSAECRIHSQYKHKLDGIWDVRRAEKSGALHSTTQHNTAQLSTTQLNTAQHYTARSSTTQHRSVINGTLHGGRNTWWATSQISLVGFSWSFIPPTFQACAWKYVNFFAICQ